MALESKYDLLNRNYSSWHYLENGLAEKEDRMPVSVCAGSPRLPWLPSSRRFWGECLCRHFFPILRIFFLCNATSWSMRAVTDHEVGGAHCSSHGLVLWVATTGLTTSRFKRTENSLRATRCLGCSQNAVHIDLIFTPAFETSHADPTVESWL